MEEMWANSLMLSLCDHCGVEMEWSSMDYLRVFFSQARASRGTSIVRKRAGCCSEVWIAMPWTVNFWNILKVLASMAIECCEAPIFSWPRLRMETTVRKPSFSVDGGWTDYGLGCEMDGWPKMDLWLRYLWRWRWTGTARRGWTAAKDVEAYAGRPEEEGWWLRLSVAMEETGHWLKVQYY